MPSMSKIEINPKMLLLVALAIACSLMVVPVSFGKNVFQIETGNYESASWQFTVEFSELWQKNFPELESGFSPVYTENTEKRFSNLIEKNSRFVIAPLDTAANQIMLSRPVKLVTLLWTVYLVPVDIDGKNETINLSNYRYWYVLDHSVIVSELMQALNKPFFSEALRTQYQKRMSVAGLSDEPETDLADSEDELYDAQAINESDDQLGGNSLRSLELQTEKSGSVFRQSAKIAGLDSFKAEILRVDNSMIPEIVNEYRQGILFVEMMGSINHLKKSFEFPISTTGFEQNIQDFLVSVHPWIQPVYKSRVRLRTLEFNMALYVHADEDAEFVESIIKLLSDRQKTYFPISFIFGNLTIQKTKELSPLYIHAGSLKYFDLD